MRKLSCVLLLAVAAPELPGCAVAGITPPGPRYPGKIVPDGFFNEDRFL
jgi:hypothetical protein